jgi:F-type H+-transporting ATPase subunit delta
MRNVRVARRYARALMATVTDSGQVDATSRDLESIGSTLKASRDLRLLLASPVVTPVKKTKIIRGLFGGKVGAHTLAFLGLLIEKHREGHLSEIVEQFGQLHDEAEGIMTVEVKSAVELPAPQRETLHKEMERLTGKKVRLQFSIEPSIRGGLVVRVGDTVRDASVQRQLEILRTRFIEGGGLSN